MPYIDPTNPAHFAFKASFPQACENFENDAELNDEQKLKFVAHLEAAGTLDLEDHLKVFFYDPKNQRVGSIVTLLNDERLGCVRTMISFAAQIVKESMIDDLDDEAVSEQIRALGLATEETLNKKLTYWGVGLKKIKPHTMWSFIYKISGISDSSSLPCRLGLPSFSASLPQPHVFFSHDLPVHLPPSKPTLFDACIEGQWCPGGNTKPFKECSSKGGIPEVVHEPNVFNSIVGQLLII